MRKTKRNILLIIIALALSLNLVGCGNAEEKAMAEKRTYISTSITSVIDGDNDHKYEKLSDFAEVNKGKYVQWKIKVDEVKDSDDIIYYVDGDSWFTKIECKFNYSIKDKVKVGDDIIISGKLDDWSFISEKIVLTNCRIDNLSEEELAERKLEKEAEIKEQEEERKTEENKKVQEETKANLKWTKENIVALLKENNVLDKDMNFCDNLDGSKVYVHDNSIDGKTNVQNAYSLHLTIDLNEKQIKDKELLKKIAFNISKVINDNSSKIDFNINFIRITFGDFKNNQYGENLNNFNIGINTIKNYFSEPRSTSVGVSGATGEVKQIDFDKESFFKWIEDNFTLPEDNSVLAENNSWTTLSSKGAIK